MQVEEFDYHDAVLLSNILPECGEILASLGETQAAQAATPGDGCCHFYVCNAGDKQEMTDRRIGQGLHPWGAGFLSVSIDDRGLLTP